MRLKNLLLLAIIFVPWIGIVAQFKLIPTPKEIIINDSYFILNQYTKILNPKSDDFYTEEISECILHELDIVLTPSTKKPKHNYIELLKFVSEEELEKAIKENGLNEEFNLGREGYIIKITPENIKILSQTNAGIFYGIQTLKQLIIANMEGNKLPSLIIYDSPDFKVRAWQDDISRGPIPTMDYLKEQIKKMSSFKLNYFTLYTEHVFKLNSHPVIAPEDGITQEDIQNLSKFASKYHVTLIGNFQSFGHMAKTLEHPKYQHLVENGHIISPALNESYEFLSDVYEEVAPAYNGQYFNINCDETFGLGTGVSKTMVDSIGIEGVYVSHINKLDSLLAPYDKSILMWGDIAANHPDIVSNLPKDIIVMVWGYHAADNFDYAIIPISSQGLDFWVAPGVNCWRNIYPNMHAAEINIFNFIRDGYKLNASGVLNTTWDDDGLNFFENNYHGLVWGAENSWNAPTSNIIKEESEIERVSTYNNFNIAFDIIFYGLKDEQLTNHIIEFSKLHQSKIRDIEKNNRFFEPVFPIYSDYVMKSKREENIKILNFTDSLTNYITSTLPYVKRNGLSIEYLQYAINQVRFTVLKNLLRIDIYDFLEGDYLVTEAELIEEINILANDVRYLQSQYEILWKKESKNWWLSVNMEKFDNLYNSILELKGHCMIIPDDSLTETGRKIEIKSLFSSLPVYYSLGSDSISINSSLYHEPLHANEDVKIFAKVIDGNRDYPSVADSMIFHKGIGKLYKLSSTYSSYHPSYDGGGTMALLDGKTGNPNELRSGRWQGFSGQNIELEIDMGSKEPISTFSMGFFQNTFSWVIFPKKVEIYYKDRIEDDYQLLETITNNIPPEEEGNLKQDYTASFQNFSTRYLKIVAVYYGKLPHWHHSGSIYESMLFSDEIILN